MFQGKPPSIILYTDEQLADFRSFLDTDSEHVVGVDRTFNLGRCYVTTMVYKNLKVRRTATDDHPVMLGPMYLHWDGSYDSYHPFFAHIKRKLDASIDGMALLGSDGMIHLGSDDEKALLKALKSNFPDATQHETHQR